MIEGKIVRPQSDGRISLARFGVKPGQKFRVHTDALNRVILTPVEERENHESSAERGAQDARADREPPLEHDER